MAQPARTPPIEYPPGTYGKPGAPAYRLHLTERPGAVTPIRVYWKLADLAERWDVHPHTLRRMVGAGDLHAIKIAAEYRVPDSERARIEAQRETAPADVTSAA